MILRLFEIRSLVNLLNIAEHERRIIQFKEADNKNEE